MKEKDKKAKDKKEDRLDSRLRGNDREGGKDKVGGPANPETEYDKGLSLGKDLQAENSALKEMLQRAQADFINYRRRAELEKMEMAEYGKLETIKELLEVFDNFERARNHIPKELEGNEWIGGILAIEKQFKKKLEDLGVKKMETIGRMFDPNLHEAIQMAEAENMETHRILEEFEPGYMYKDKVLKHAKVKIAK